MQKISGVIAQKMISNQNGNGMRIKVVMSVRDAEKFNNGGKYLKKGAK